MRQFPRVPPRKQALQYPSEHQEQVALFEWAALAVATHPELRLLHAIPNGGARHPAVAAKLKAEGVKPGVPDVCLPVPRGRWHGLYVEMKSQSGRLRDSQREFGELLSIQGYRVVVCLSWDEARNQILEYLGAAHAPTKGPAHYRQEGYLAHFGGKALESCPYREGSEEAARWKGGWEYRAGAGVSKPGMPARKG